VAPPSYGWRCYNFCSTSQQESDIIDIQIAALERLDISNATNDEYHRWSNYN
jgi:hypothetical protein